MAVPTGKEKWTKVGRCQVRKFGRCEGRNRARHRRSEDAQGLAGRGACFGTHDVHQRCQEGWPAHEGLHRLQQAAYGASCLLPCLAVLPAFLAYCLPRHTPFCEPPSPVWPPYLPPTPLPWKQHTRTAGHNCQKTHLMLQQPGGCSPRTCVHSHEYTWTPGELSSCGQTWTEANNREAPGLGLHTYRTGQG